ncbi:MAG: hypothetical protein HYR91_07900 [Flavobacteriia bacterium]|nr:hypothetical protein [Flavobacteriia bacterium]
MSSSGLTMMLITEISITVITGYFFFKVLFTKPNSEPDSYLENDDEER